MMLYKKKKAIVRSPDWDTDFYDTSKQHLSKQQLYGHLPPILKTIQVRRTRYF